MLSHNKQEEAIQGLAEASSGTFKSPPGQVPKKIKKIKKQKKSSSGTFKMPPGQVPKNN